MINDRRGYPYWNAVCVSSSAGVHRASYWNDCIAGGAVPPTVS